MNFQGLLGRPVMRLELMERLCQPSVKAMEQQLDDDLTVELHSRIKQRLEFELNTRLYIPLTNSLYRIRTYASSHRLATVMANKLSIPRPKVKLRCRQLGRLITSKIRTEVDVRLDLQTSSRLTRELDRLLDNNLLDNLPGIQLADAFEDWGRPVSDP